jgi:hypothetical protein
MRCPKNLPEPVGMKVVRGYGVLVISAVLLWSVAAPVGATWPSDPTVNLPIVTSPITHHVPQIIPAGAGGAIIVWEELRLVAPDSVIGGIFAQRVSPGGELLWAVDGVPVGLATQGEGPLAPQVVSDGDYGGIMVWEDNPGADWDIFAQRIGPFGEKLWDAEGVAICNATGDQGQIQMTSDGEGGAIITWVDYRNGSYSDLYAQRIDPYGVVLWTLEGVPICVASRDQTEQRVVPDGAHGAILVWQDERNLATTSEDVFAQRVDAGGTPLWTSNGIPICVEIGRQLGADIADDHVGGAVMGWQDLRGFGEPGDVYAQRVDGAGSVLWTLNGVAVCEAPSTQSEPDVLADGDSATYLCWTDSRNGTADVYAQRIDGLGNPLWTANGVSVSSAARNQYSPETVSVVGDVVIAWQDSRNVQFETDIYAQRLDSEGNARWTEGGVPVTTAPKWQYRLQIVPDLSGGVILAWEDGRNSEWYYDVYAQRIDSTGALSTPTGIEPSNDSPVFELSPAIPNPAGGVMELQFYLPTRSQVAIEIYDVLGRRVRSERIGTLGRGQNQYIFDGKNDMGNTVPSGVYFARVSVGGLVRTQKFVISR